MEEKTGVEPTTDMLDMDISNLDHDTLMFFQWMENPWIQAAFLALTIWTAIWKGMALWRAARNSQLAWFIALLIVNTMGILEIIYIAFFQKKPKKVKAVAQRKAPAKKKMASKKKTEPKKKATPKRKIAKK